jgi:glucan phosphorylase
MRQDARRVLVDKARARLELQLARRGEDVSEARRVLDPEVLTLGLARRFAEYKRPTLHLRETICIGRDTPEVGWVLGDGYEGPDADARDAAELYALLEGSVAPEFYDRGADGLPHRWLARVRASMTRLAPAFSCNRMARDYSEQLYRPAGAQLRHRIADGGKLARDLGCWQRIVQGHWPQLAFDGFEVRGDGDGRVVPVHEDACLPIELPLLLWSR